MTAQPHRERGKRRNDAAHPAKGQDYAQSSSKQTHAAGDAAAKQHLHGKHQRRSGQPLGQASSAQAGPAQHVDGRDPSGAPARGDDPHLTGSKRNRPETSTAAGAVSHPVVEAVASHSTGAQQTAGHGLPHAQHKGRQRHTTSAGQQQATAGGQGAPVPASASAAEQRTTQQASAQPQHARKKRRLQAGAGANAGAATVTINGVEVRTVVAAPPKGESSGHRRSSTQLSC